MKILVVISVCLALSGTSTHGLKKVPKAVSQQVYAHVMPWFETRETNNGAWGIHWTMANQNPDNVDGSGKRQIATHYYPEIGPYGSGDPSVIEYQLNLMRIAGIDGVLMDWPGTVNAWDYPKNLQNANAMIDRTQNFGLGFAIVYEDHNIGMAHDAGFIGDKLQAGRQDMSYISNNYFTRGNYIRVNNAPLLLDFGPQTFKSPSDWSNIFQSLSQRPTFLTLWYQSQEAAGSSAGEYPWIYFDFIDGLNNFYFVHQPGVKFGVAYPGFHTFYTIGGWPGPEWTIGHNGLGTFTQTLDLAINGGVQWIQLATWNDYGEGTMVEPTREFGNGFLNVLQQKLKVPYGDREINLIKDLYNKRKQFEGQKEVQSNLDQVQAAILDLEFDHVEQLLTKF